LRILDDKKRLFGIVNPIDAIVIVAVLVGIVVIANVLFGVNPTSVRVGHGSKPVEIVWTAKGVHDFVPADLKVGQKVTRSGGASVMGNIVAVRSAPATEEALTADGAIKLATSPFDRDVFITIRGRGDVTEDGAFLGDEQVRVNMDMDLLAPTWQCKGKVLSLRLVPATEVQQ
jgi:hypothetical protein